MESRVTQIDLPDGWSLEIKSRSAIRATIDQLNQANAYQISIYLVKADVLPILTMQLNILDDSIEFVDIDSSRQIRQLMIGQNQKIKVTLA